MLIISSSKLLLLRVSKSSIYLTVSLNLLAIHKLSLSCMTIHNEIGTGWPTEGHNPFP